MSAVDVTAARPSARAELLLLAAVTVAGGLAGVLVQAGVEVARNGRAQREQLQAAADQLDALDAELQKALSAATQLAIRCDRAEAAERAHQAWNLADERRAAAGRERERAYGCSCPPEWNVCSCGAE